MKSRITAALLAFFFGGLGFHKFYMGKIGAGILSVLFCWTFIPYIVGLVEFCLYIGESNERFQERIPKK